MLVVCMITNIYQKIIRRAAIYWRIKKLTGQGIRFVRPNYIFYDRFDGNSVMIDVGCGYEAELAMHLVKHYGIRSFGLDPTRKHAPALKLLEKASQGKFTHIGKAVARTKGRLVFHESEQNESGSLLEDHTNVANDTIQSYEVDTVTLKELPAITGTTQVDFLKLDLEGAEYDLLSDLDREDLIGIKQLFVEFHHHCISRYSPRDTLSIVKNLESIGLKSHTLDEHNFLFYWG